MNKEALSLKKYLTGFREAAFQAENVQIQAQPEPNSH